MDYKAELAQIARSDWGGITYHDLKREMTRVYELLDFFMSNDFWVEGYLKVKEDLNVYEPQEVKDILERYKPKPEVSKPVSKSVKKKKK